MDVFIILVALALVGFWFWRKRSTVQETKVAEPFRMPYPKSPPISTVRDDLIVTNHDIRHPVPPVRPTMPTPPRIEPVAKGPAWTNSSIVSDRPQPTSGQTVQYEGRTYTVDRNGGFRDSNGMSVTNSILIGALSGLAVSALYDAFAHRRPGHSDDSFVPYPDAGRPDVIDSTRTLGTPAVPSAWADRPVVVPDVDLSRSFDSAPARNTDIDLSEPTRTEAPSAWASRDRAPDVDLSGGGGGRGNDVDVDLGRASFTRDDDIDVSRGSTRDNDTDVSGGFGGGDSGSVDLSSDDT